MNSNWQELNALALAYIGDAVYELWVRRHLLDAGCIRVQAMHKRAVGYVRASAQARILHTLLPGLDGEEQQVVLRGRNSKGSYPRNVDVVTYRHATAFEALVGFWYLRGRQDRIDWAFGQIDVLLAENTMETGDGR